MSSEIARPEGSAYEMLKSATDQRSRIEAGQYAVTAVEVPGFDHPVPRFFFDLPWADDDGGAVDSILAQIAGADDIATATEPAELRKADALVGEPVEVFGIVARKSDVDDAKWGAYLSITASVDGGDPEVINTGAGEVCVVLWRLYCEGRLPCRGVFDVKGQPVKGRKQPLTFRVEETL